MHSGHPNAPRGQQRMRSPSKSEHHMLKFASGLLASLRTSCRLFREWRKIRRVAMNGDLPIEPPPVLSIISIARSWRCEMDLFVLDSVVTIPCFRIGGQASRMVRIPKETSTFNVQMTHAEQRQISFKFLVLLTCCGELQRPILNGIPGPREEQRVSLLFSGRLVCVF